MMVTEFQSIVYEAVSCIPKGKVATYGQVARMIGMPGAARAVGNALHKNPFAPVVPCHRVVASDGSLGSNFGFGGPAGQYERLMAEGISFIEDKRGGFPRVDLKVNGLCENASD